MSLDEALEQAVSNIPECVAAGCVDLTTGMLIGIRSIEPQPPDVMDLVAAATADLFQGANVASIQGALDKARGTRTDLSHYFKEVVVLSDHLIHVFLRSKKNREHVAGFACRKAANIGIALTRSRQAMDLIEAAD
jgi:hypothetical protein